MYTTLTIIIFALTKEVVRIVSFNLLSLHGENEQYQLA